MTINLDEITWALGEAAQGPWTYEQNGKRGAWIGNNGNWSALSCGNTDEEATANAHLIAHAPEWLRLLVERVRKLEQELAWRCNPSATSGTCEFRRK